MNSRVRAIPPTCASFSTTVTGVPCRVSSKAADSPAGPAPITATWSVDPAEEPCAGPPEDTPEDPPEYPTESDKVEPPMPQRSNSPRATQLAPPSVAGAQYERPTLLLPTMAPNSPTQPTQPTQPTRPTLQTHPFLDRLARGPLLGDGAMG